MDIERATAPNVALLVKTVVTTPTRTETKEG